MSEHNDAAHWTEEAWASWAQYADRVDVEVRFVSSLSHLEEAEEVWCFDSGPEGTGWDKAWLERNLAELATADPNSCCGDGNYFLDSRTRRTQWGASSAVQEFVLTLSQAILADATWRSLLKLADHASKRYGFNPVATAEQAVGHSRSRVLLRGAACTRDDLEVLSATEEDGAWTVVVKVQPTEDVFTVVTECTSSGCPVSRIKRRELGKEALGN